MTNGLPEGVIKYRLDFRKGPLPSPDYLIELNNWRRIFKDYRLIGQNPDRYGGLGFGNLSRRLPGGVRNEFLITGTQTEHMDLLTPESYVTVLDCVPEANRLVALGMVKPSSEAISHAAIYQSCPRMLWVMHVHSPEIFAHYEELRLPFTDPTIDYGTPAMAAEIARIARQHTGAGPCVLVMAGHQDGVLAFGDSAENTGSLILATLAKAKNL